MVTRPNSATVAVQPQGISAYFLGQQKARRGPSPEYARSEYSGASSPGHATSRLRSSPSPTHPRSPVAERQPSPELARRKPIGAPQFSGRAREDVGGAIGGRMDPWPLEQARSLSPTSPSFVSQGPKVLSRPMTQQQWNVRNAKNRRDVFGVKKVANPEPVRPPFVFAPYKRYPTTYVDAFTAPRRPRTHTRTLTSQMRKNDGFFGMPPQPRPRPDKFPGVTSRFTKDLPKKMELKEGERIVIRNTRLCYHENKYTYHRCEHSFKIAREVRQAEVERRQLMRLRRVHEIGDHRPQSQWLYGLKQREKARNSALRAIEESKLYLLELDKLEDPMAAERERAVWRIDVARQRLRIADEMDEIDLMLEMDDDDASDNGNEEKGRNRFERPPVDERFITIEDIDGFDRQTGLRRMHFDEDRTNRVMPIPKDIAQKQYSNVRSRSPSERSRNKNDEANHFNSPTKRSQNRETRPISPSQKADAKKRPRGFLGVTSSPEQSPRSKAAPPRSRPAPKGTKPVSKGSSPSSPHSSSVSPRSNPASPRLNPASPRSNPASPRSNPASPRSNPVSPRSNPASPRSNPASPRSNPASQAKGTTWLDSRVGRDVQQANFNHEGKQTTKAAAKGAGPASVKAPPRERVSSLLQKLMTPKSKTNDMQTEAQLTAQKEKSLRGAVTSGKVARSVSPTSASSLARRDERRETVPLRRTPRKTTSTSSRNSTIKELLKKIERDTKQEKGRGRGE